MPLESFYLLNFKIYTTRDHGKDKIKFILITKREKPKGNPVKIKSKPKIFQ